MRTRSASRGGDRAGRYHPHARARNASSCEITKQERSARGREPGAPFNQAFYLIFNLAVGGPWAGPAGLSVSRKYLDIDWVRVYRAP